MLIIFVIFLGVWWMGTPGRKHKRRRVVALRKPTRRRATRILDKEIQDGNGKCSTRPPESLRCASPHERSREGGQRGAQHRPAPARGPSLDLGRLWLASQPGAASLGAGRVSGGAVMNTSITTNGHNGVHNATDETIDLLYAWMPPQAPAP